MIQKSVGVRVFQVFNYLFFTLLTILMVFPFWHVIMMSFSDHISTQSGGIFLWPKGFNLDTYRSVFKNPQIFTGFFTSVFVTVTSTVLGTLLTAMAAFALSKSRLHGGKFLLYMILFTMLFSGGMIPNYLLIKSLNLIDSRWALILPNLINAYNLIIMRNFFLAIPSSLEESARIDGANDLTIFFRIVLPLSKASLATIALFIAVGYWNDYFSTVIYILTRPDRWSLQAVLRYMLTNTTEAMSAAGVQTVSTSNVTAQTIKSASIVIATVPILLVYPFVQKYFVKGVMLGSVKG